MKRCYNKGSWSYDFSCEYYLPAGNGVSTEAEESPLLEAVTRERLVKTQLAGKGLAGDVVICEL
jgi:hypothetical protein